MKVLLIAVLLSCCFSQCKPTKFAFDESDLDQAFFQNLINQAGGISNTWPDSLNNQPEDFSTGEFRIYSTVLTDKYRNRDGIAEETIVNTRNKSESTGLEMKGNSYHLFIMVAKDATGKEKGAIFLPTIFDAEDDCIGLGPALVGTWGAGELNYYKTLSFKPIRKSGNAKAKDSIEISFSRKKNKYKKSGSIYHPKDQSETRIELIFKIDSLQDVINLYYFDVKKIYNMAQNRFGGDKPLFFDIEKIFSDPAALHFIFRKPE